jgi:shikimate dehydrogenase
MVKKLAVIGKDVSKSISPQIHAFIAKRLNIDISYDKISIPEDEFESRIDGIIQTYDGVNVTIPYKIVIKSHLEKVVGDGKIFGAVNTVLCGNLTGDNTDGLGFMLMLVNNGVNVAKKKALVLGAGGAGRSVVKKLTDAGAEVYVYDKNFSNSCALGKEFGVSALCDIKSDDYFLIVNATGVGMHKTEGLSPVDEEVLNRCEVAIDLIYVPEKSAFLKIAESLGKKIINGKAMLFYQAYYADCIFFGLKPDVGQAKTLFTQFLSEGL